MLPPFLQSAAETVLDVLHWHGGKMFLDAGGWQELSARGVSRSAAERALDTLHAAGIVLVKLIGDSAMVRLLGRAAGPEVPPPQPISQRNHKPRFAPVWRGGGR